MKKKIIFWVSILVIVISIGYTNIRINNIESQLNGNDKVEESKETVKTEITLQGENATYIQAKFPSVGEYCIEVSDSITFYSDIECTKEIINPRFLSRTYDLIYVGDRRVYCYLLDNGQICYSRGDKYPELLPESYYNMIYKTE